MRKRGAENEEIKLDRKKELERKRVMVKAKERKREKA